MNEAVIHIGDALDVLRTLPDADVHTCVTSPPYWGLRDYGTAGQLGLERTPEEYVQKMVEVFREVRRVLREDGTLWLNLGDSYNSAPGWGRGGGSTLDGRQQGTIGGPVRLIAGCKPKDLVGIPWLVAFALRNDGWYLRSDIIWCLSGGTRVYARTQKGEMPMTIKDLVRLDPSKVKLWNGEKWTQVLGWSETPRPEVSYEIELRTGERVGCTAGHFWPTQRGNVRADELHIGDVIQTCTLPEPEHPRHPQGLGFTDVGWFVGMYIAEGSRSGKTIQIACHADDDKRFERLRRLAEAFDGTAKMHQTEGNAATINIHCRVLDGILQTYVAGNDSADKHLSMRCWRRANVFLKSILDGYLEGDAHYDGYNARYRLGFCKNDGWASDLRTICARLGATLRLRRCFHKYGQERFPGYRGEIRFERSGHHNEKPDGEVIAIRASRARKFWDIGVADEPHLFALASGLLTHNSKPNAMPESVTDRPTKAHEYLFLLSKSARYFYDTEAIKEEAVNGDPDAPRASRGVLRMPNSGVRKQDEVGNRTYTGFNGSVASVETRNKRTVWTIPTAPFNDWQRTVRQVDVALGAVSGDTKRRPSEGCPLHASLDRSHPILERDARAAYNRYRSPGTHDYLLQERLTDSAPTAPIHAPGLQGYSSDSRDQPCSGTATDHSTRTNKTGPALATIAPCTPSAQTPDCILNTSVSPGSSEPDASICASNTGSAGLDDSPSSHTHSHSAGSVNVRQSFGAWLADQGCTCVFYEETSQEVSHFATFPAELIEPCILAGSPARGTVLDPFNGAGTTGLVALAKGRNYIGIEINPAYVEMSRRRIEQDSPMFNRVRVIPDRMVA